MLEAVAVKDRAGAFAFCEDAVIQSYKDGIDREAVCLEIAEKWSLPIEPIIASWEEWKSDQEVKEWTAKREAEKAEASFILPTVQPIRVESKVGVVPKLRRLGEKPKVKPVLELKAERKAEQAAAEVPEPLRGAAGKALSIVGRMPILKDVPDTELSRTALIYVEAMNTKHCLIGNYGGKCMVLDWVPSERDPNNLVPSFQSLTSFKQRYNDRFIPTDNGLKHLGDFWLGHRDKRWYDGVIFHPGAPAVIHSGQGGEYCCRLNLWRGWGVEPKEGDWSRMQNHIKVVLAGGDEERERYILNWTAYGYQNPGVKRRVLLALRGPEGCGKGIFGHSIKRTYGSHGLYITQPSQVTGKFNKHLRTCCFAFLDEAFWAGNKEAEGPLKSLISEEEQMTEGKGIDSELTMNWVDVMLASNSAWVVPAGPNARRFAIFDVDDRYGEDRVTNEERKAYFRPLWHEMQNGGLEAMMFDLMQRPLGDWDPQDIPKTEALMDQKQLSLRGWDRMYESWLQEGVLPRDLEWNGRPDCATTEAMLGAARRFRGLEHESASSLKKYLRAMGADTTWRTGGEGRAGAKFPSLPEARETFAKKFGGKWPWVENLEKW